MFATTPHPVTPEEFPDYGPACPLNVCASVDIYCYEYISKKNCPKIYNWNQISCNEPEMINPTCIYLTFFVYRQDWGVGWFKLTLLEDTCNLSKLIFNNDCSMFHLFLTSEGIYSSLFHIVFDDLQANKNVNRTLNLEPTRYFYIWKVKDALSKILKKYFYKLLYLNYIILSQQLK